MLILIGGITGLVGQAVAKAGLAAGHKVRGLARNPSKISADLLSQLESLVRCNDYYDLTAVDQAVKDVDAIVCAYFPEPKLVLEAQLLLLRAAERANVKVFRAASWNFPWERDQLGDHETYDAYLMFRAYARITSSINPVNGFTGIIFEYMLQSMPWKNDATGELPHFGPADKPYAYIGVENLAAYTIEAISASDAAKDDSYYVESFKCSYLELAETYQQVCGKELTPKCMGMLGDVETMLGQARAATPAHEHAGYVVFAYMKYMLNGLYDYEAVDSKRWSHVKQSSLKELFEQNPEA